jgi:UDP-glucose 4-epimerase
VVGKSSSGRTERLTSRVLVTGAAGFIGSHVVDHCLSAGMHVVATDDLSGGFRANVAPRAEWIEGDLREAEFVSSLWAGGRFDAVYHLAAYAAEGLSHFIRAYNYRTNLEASVNLINQAVLGQTSRFVFTSSIAVYGAGQVPMSEDMVPRPEDPYGISKYAVELDLAAAHKMFGLEYTIFRPHNVYGERQNIADPYRNVIGIFLNNALRGEPMPVFGDGLQTRAFSHVDDVAPIIARAPAVIESANAVYNIGADTPYSILELAEEIGRAVGVQPVLTHLPPRNEVLHAFSDHGKVRAAFDPPEPLDLKTGIQRMAAWVLEQGARDPIEFAGQIEIDRDLPPSWVRRTQRPADGYPSTDA